MAQFTVNDLRTHPGDSAFLLDDGTVSVLYDTGFAFTGTALVEKLRAILGDRPLDYIFLTHSHYDHAAGSSYVKRAYPGAVVVASGYAATVFAKPSARAVMRELDRKAAAGCGVNSYEDLIDCLSVDRTVSDSDAITAGDHTFTVLSLPGHTKCSIGFYSPKDQLLLCCETVGVFNGRDDVVPSYLVGYEMTMASIARVCALDVRRLLVPHYGVIEGKTLAFFLQRAEDSARETAEEILLLLQQGKTKEEIVARFKDRFYREYIQTIYPIDAMLLNTSITVDLLERELL